MVVGAATGGVFASFVGFAVRRLDAKQSLIATGIQAVSLILIFAGIYRGYGLIFGSEYKVMTDDPAGALYFSVVTWTTLGYGDFSPPEGIRLVAATEAILGYVVFGVSIGLVTFLMSKNETT